MVGVHDTFTEKVPHIDIPKARIPQNEDETRKICRSDVRRDWIGSTITQSGRTDQTMAPRPRPTRPSIQSYNLSCALVTSPVFSASHIFFFFQAVNLTNNRGMALVTDKPTLFACILLTLYRPESRSYNSRKRGRKE